MSSRTNHRRPKKKKRKKGQRPRIRAGKALYRCQGCGHRWYQDPGMVDCPVCKCIHVEWLNYDELERAGAFPEREKLLGY